jgi:hypothetical protein
MVEESYVNRTGKTTLRQKKLKQQTCDKEEKKKKKQQALVYRKKGQNLQHLEYMKRLSTKVEEN